MSEKEGVMQLKYRHTSLLISLYVLLGLVCPAIVIFKVSSVFKDQVINDEKTAFEKGIDVIDERLSSFHYGLQSYAGIYMVSGFQPSREDLEKYARSRDYFRKLKSLLGYGFIRKVPGSEADEYIRERRKLRSDFKFKFINALESNDYYVVEHMEPLNPNLNAIGLVLSSEDIRYKTLRLALESGKATISPKLTMLSIVSGHRFPGYLYVNPVFRSGEIFSSTKDRYENLVGWTFTVIDNNQLREYLKTVFHNDMHLEIFDQNDESLINTHPDHIVANDSDHTFRKSVMVGQRKWTFQGSSVNSSYVRFIHQISMLIFFLVSSIMTYFFFKFYLVLEEKKTSDIRNIELEKWRAAILDSASFAIITVSPQSDIVSFNRAAEKMLGYKAEDVINKLSPAVFHDPDEVVEYHKELEEEAEQKIEFGIKTLTYRCSQQEFFAREWTFITATKERIPVRLLLSALRNTEGEIIGYLGIAEDLTEIHAMKKSMINNAKMSALGEMAGSVAHEINNPLAIIMASIKMMNKVIASKKSAEEKFAMMSEVADEVEKTTVRIAKIVTGLRSFARESSHDPMVQVDIDQVISDTVSLCQEKFKQKDIDLIYEKENPELVTCRPVQLSQVLMNLLGNAADAIENLEEKWIKIQVIKCNGSLQLLVTDSGSGIPEHYLKSMFNPFFTTKPAGKGTGLGLSISKGIMESHKGTLEYRLNENHTQFVLTLPKAA